MRMQLPVLAADKHRLSLGGIEKGSQTLFGVGGRDDLHLSIIDKIDKLDNIRDALVLQQSPRNHGASVRLAAFALLDSRGLLSQHSVCGNTLIFVLHCFRVTQISAPQRNRDSRRRRRPVGAHRGGAPGYQRFPAAGRTLERTHDRPRRLRSCYVEGAWTQAFSSQHQSDTDARGSA